MEGWGYNSLMRGLLGVTLWDVDVGVGRAGSAHAPVLFDRLADAGAALGSGVGTEGDAEGLALG